MEGYKTSRQALSRTRFNEGMLTTETILVAAEGLAAADLDDEAILLDVNSGTYYGLNEVGAHIMALLQEPKSVNGLIDIMLEEYEVEPERLKHDLMIFLREMEDQQLVRVMNGAVLSLIHI